MYRTPSQVWNCEDQILAILTDARTRNEGAFDRALICCSVSEAAHACSSPRPDVWHETTFKCEYPAGHCEQAFAPASANVPSIHVSQV